MSRTFLVTGASKGIGLALATRLAASDHHVVGLARSAPSDFPGTFFSVDLGDDGATRAALNRIAQRFELDGVVNNVGQSVPPGWPTSRWLSWMKSCASVCIPRSPPHRQPCRA